MRRADRLFEIIQLLRRKPTVTARDLSDALEVSERTIYRDIRDLIASGVPIQGEAGIGYVLKSGFDLPPLMFKESEIEALVLGARIVESWADEELADSATVRPRSLAYVGPVWLLAAWCELREDFRTFRLDRIENFAVLEERFRPERGKTLHDFLKRPQTWSRSALTAVSEEEH